MEICSVRQLSVSHAKLMARLLDACPDAGSDAATQSSRQCGSSGAVLLLRAACHGEQTLAGAPAAAVR
jgi:hypothetical protein